MRQSNVRRQSWSPSAIGNPEFRKGLLPTVAFGLILAGASPAVAQDTLFSQAPGSANVGIGGVPGPARLAHSFVLDADASVMCVEWWGDDIANNGYGTLTFDISIWTSDGSGVDDAGLVAIESFPITDVYQGPFDTTADSFMASFSSPVLLTSGTEYWIAIGVSESVDWSWLVQGMDSPDALGDGFNDIDLGSDGVWDGPAFFGSGDQSLAFRICGEEIITNEPPVISCGEPAVLWEPNHEFVDITTNLYNISDPDGDAVTETITVVSDESEVPETGDGTGKHAPDFKTTLADGSAGFFLRSERQGPGDGRVYLVIVTADDGTDSVTRVCVAAVAPHDQNDDSRDLVLAEAAARAADLQLALDTLGPGNVDYASLGLRIHGVSDELGKKQ